VAAAVLCVVTLSACATGPRSDPPPDPTLAPDPFEGFNRVMLHVNTGFENVIAKPADTVYRGVTPRPVRKGISNAVDNLGSPVTFLNDLLQGRPGRAGKTLIRFIVNSVIGIAGFFDIAKSNGLPPHQEDFGQTLAVWGVKNGPFLILPMIGPTTVRDGIGYGIDTISDPLYWLVNNTAATYAIVGTETLVQYDNARDQLKSLRQSSIDFYSALRSAYLQHRQSEIYNGDLPHGDTMPDILDSLPEDEQPPAE
jgi:phospholipid-binding lipoprotein MlaA